MAALVQLLAVLTSLARMKNGGADNDLSILLNYARLGVAAGDKGKKNLEEAVAKVEQLVAEDRALTDEERAELDGKIEALLDRAAAVEIPTEGGR